jgi:hypothetical protein
MSTSTQEKCDICWEQFDLFWETLIRDPRNIPAEIQSDPDFPMFLELARKANDHFAPKKDTAHLTEER